MIYLFTVNYFSFLFLQRSINSSYSLESGLSFFQLSDTNGSLLLGAYGILSNLTLDGIFTASPITNPSPVLRLGSIETKSLRSSGITLPTCPRSFELVIRNAIRDPNWLSTVSSNSEGL